MMMNKNINEVIPFIEVFRQASSQSTAALAASGTIRCLAKGEHLFFDKEPVEMLYIVVSGLVALYKINSQGEKKVIFIVGKGKMINEVVLQEQSASVNCEVFETAQILCFHRISFLRIMEQDFALTKDVFASAAMKVRRLYRQLKNTSTSVRGDKRLAAKLWKLSGDYGVQGKAGTKIDIDLSITYLADMLGSQRESVSRQLKVLAEQGLIQMHHGQITIPDRDKLSAYFKLS